MCSKMGRRVGHHAERKEKTPGTFSTFGVRRETEPIGISSRRAIMKDSRPLCFSPPSRMLSPIRLPRHSIIPASRMASQHFATSQYMPDLNSSDPLHRSTPFVEDRRSSHSTFVVTCRRFRGRRQLECRNKGRPVLRACRTNSSHLWNRF